MTTDQLYRYLAPSTATRHGTNMSVDLATSGGPSEHPWLAEGFVRSAQPAARALLVVATVAGKRFWAPPNMVAAAITASDPVVTASPDALRFESFSLCCGVYARFDLDADALDGTIHRHGTTNVDVNPPLRSALSRVGASDPLLVRVGVDEVVAATLTGQHVEKKVPLPSRWVRGFAEVAIAMAPLDPVFELTGSGLKRFLETLPRTSAPTHAWVVPSGRSARITTRPAGGSVPATGIERLGVLRDIGPLLTSVTAHAARGSSTGPSAWVAPIDGGRLTIALSPTPSRGFSGEGGLLLALATGAGDDTIEAASMGRRGFDPATAQWFARDLPFDRSLLAPEGGRLANARSLASSGAVAPDPGGTAADVTSRNNLYRVRLVDDEWHCTCPWWAKHGTDAARASTSSPP